MIVWAAAALAALAVAWVLPVRATVPSRAESQPVPSRGVPDGWMLRWRWLWAALAATACATFVSGRWGLAFGLGAGVTVWVVIGRAEPPATRRHREAAERDLPGLVHLLAAALATGLATGPAVRTVCAAYPGAAADLLAPVPASLALGVAPEVAWEPALAHPALAPLGRTMVRAHRSGSSVAAEVARLADELAQASRVRVEEQARSVGVKAAIPLGLCLLPSFVLIGIVPLVVGLMQSLHL